MSNIIENFEAEGSNHDNNNHIHINDDILTKLIEYNELKKNYEEYMLKKEKILKVSEENDKITRAREIIKKRVDFNKKWLNILKTATLITHIVLILIIMVMLVYKIY